MLAALPFCVCALAALALMAVRTDRPMALRHAVLIAAVLTGVWTAVGTELLSPGRALSRGPVTLWWAVPCAALGAFVPLRARDLRASLKLPDRPCVQTGIILALAVALLALTGAVAATTPTNTWDCIAYHMPRQFYWAQQLHIANFPAHDLRQLEMPPWAEFAGLHLMILSGGDHWSNMIQWFAFLGLAIAAWCFAEELGATPRACALAALLAVANPAAATQAENGKNDVVLALWICTLAWLAARVWNQRRIRPSGALLVGATLGLAALTKGTGLIFALPFCVVIAAGMLLGMRWRALPWGAVVALVAIWLNAGHFARNQAAFGSPLGQPRSRGGYDLASTTFMPTAIASGVIRNLTLHTGTPFRSVNAWQQAQVEGLHALMNVDPSDPRTTILVRRFPYAVAFDARADGGGGAPLHIALGAIALVIGIIGRRRFSTWPLRLAPLVAFVLFATLLKWQPWHQRLHIPLVSLIGAVTAPLFFGRRREWLCLLIAVAASAVVWPNLLLNAAKPLVGRRTIFNTGRLVQGFNMRSDLVSAASAAVREVCARNPRLVGLDLRQLRCEYAVLRLLRDSLEPEVRLLNLKPNFGPKPHANTPSPDVVIAQTEPDVRMICQPATDQWYAPIATFAPFTVYERRDDIRRLPDLPIPAFTGFDRAEGLGPEEGPYPEQNIPRIRWGRGSATLLTFKGNGERAEVLFRCRRNDRFDQAMTVRINGIEALRIEFGTEWAFMPRRLELQTQVGVNTLEFRYGPEARADDENSIVFSRLQIIPGRGNSNAP